MVQLRGLASAAALLLALGAGAQAAEPRGPQDPAELEAFLDGVMAAQLEAHDVAGAALAVVAGGEVLLAKGYGHADLEARRPVRADRTLFRVGSVSKLFTWTAVMQLVEADALDLDADVNRYLDAVRVPDTFAEPVTLAHLMTHTPGFEDHVVGLFAHDAGRMAPLGELLARELPARVRPPGELASYSNHGTALAGHVVARVSGLPWERYLEERILEPLGMAYTTVRQPVPESLAAHLSKGYTYAGGEHREGGFEFVPAAPAGSMSAAAADMARFMLAHLQEGRYEGARILEPETARRMHGRLFAHAPGLNGMLHGFYEMSRNGERVFGHGGDTMLFHTLLALLPERGVGLFVSYNTAGGGAARGELFETFMDRYYPAPEPAAAEPAGSAERYAGFVGSYRGLRLSHTTLAKLAGLISVVQVSVTDDGHLMLVAGQRTRFVEVEPLVFDAVDGDARIAFREDARGRVTHLFVDAAPMIAFEKLGPTETPGFHFGVLALSALLLLTGLVAWPRSLWRPATASTPERVARAAGWGTCALLVAFLLGLAIPFSDPTEIAFGTPPLLASLLWLPLLAVPLAVAAAVGAVFVWARGYGSVAGRIHYTLVVASSLALLWFLDYWNLLGFRY